VHFRGKSIDRSSSLFSRPVTAARTFRLALTSPNQCFGLGARCQSTCGTVRHFGFVNAAFSSMWCAVVADEQQRRERAGGNLAVCAGNELRGGVSRGSLGSFCGYSFCDMRCVRSWFLMVSFVWHVRKRELEHSAK